MKNQDGRQVTCYYIHVNGVFGRNRKAKTETFDLAKHLDAPLQMEQVKELMEAKLSSLKFKSDYTYKVVERTGHVKNEGGTEIYTTNLFGGQKVLLSGPGMIFNRS